MCSGLDEASHGAEKKKWMCKLISSEWGAIQASNHLSSVKVFVSEPHLKGKKHFWFWCPVPRLLMFLAPDTLAASAPDGFVMKPNSVYKWIVENYLSLEITDCCYSKTVLIKKVQIW